MARKLEANNSSDLRNTRTCNKKTTVELPGHLVTLKRAAQLKPDAYLGPWDLRGPKRTPHKSWKMIASFFVFLIT